MTARSWPIDRARAWLLRKAAEMVDAGQPAAGIAVRRLATDAVAGDARCRNELGFRYVYSQAFCVDEIDPEVDRAVAEVYGEAPPENKEMSTTGPCQSCGATVTTYSEYTGLLPDEFIDGRRATHSWLVCKLRQEAKTWAPTTLRPAADVAREMVCHSDQPTIELNEFAVSLHHNELVPPQDVCEHAVELVAAIIDRSRAEGAATAQARIAELEAAVREAREAIGDASIMLNIHDYRDAAKHMGRVHAALSRVDERVEE